jgi:HKD family nuclease
MGFKRLKRVYTCNEELTDVKVRGLNYKILATIHLTINDISLLKNVIIIMY